MTDASFGRNLAQLHQRHDAQDQRLKDHEKRMAALEVDSAGHALRYREIDRRLTDIQSTITWFNRLVMAGLIGGILTFILNGGLNVVQ